MNSAVSSAVHQPPLKIGLVYNARSEVPDHIAQGQSSDFFAELDSDETVDAMEAGLRAAGCEVVRIGAIERLVQFLAAGNTFDGVFNFAEGLWGSARESQVPGLLDAWRIPYTFADPLTLAICLDKSITKQIWLAHGLPTTPFTVAGPDPAAADDAINALLATRPTFPMFVKPVREGSSKGVGKSSVVRNAQELRERVHEVAQRYRQPALIEPFLSGREYTVGVLGYGPEAFTLGVAEVTASTNGEVNGFDMKHPSFERNERFARVPDHALYEQMADLGLRAYRLLGCCDAGRIDIRLDAAGQPHLLEINPIAGLHPHHSALTTMARWAGLQYNTLIEKILYYARRRWSTR